MGSKWERELFGRRGSKTNRRKRLRRLVPSPELTSDYPWVVAFSLLH